MPRGYAEGPAAEAAEARLDALERGDADGPRLEERAAVYGCTEEDPERHFLGWAADVDADELFGSGRAWGISIVRTAAEREAS
jgi:hypothetical protein